MLRARRIAAVALGFGVATAFGLVACGLSAVAPSDLPTSDEAATDVPDASALDVTSPDAADAAAPGDAAVGCVADDASDGSCGDPIDVGDGGWTVVVLRASSATACPTGFAAADRVVAPTLTGNETCNCVPTSLTDPPSCDSNGPLSGAADYYAKTSCKVAVAPTVVGAACVAFSVPVLIGSPQPAAAVKFNAATHPGTCIPSCGVSAAAGATPLPICVPPPDCTDPSCTLEPPNAADVGLTYCIATSGDVSCPTDGGFVKPMKIGTSADIACVGAACKNDVECTGTLTFFSDDACMTQVSTAAADGNCNAVSGAPKALRYTGTLKSTQSEILDAGVPTVTVAAPQTVCCRPDQ